MWPLLTIYQAEPVPTTHCWLPNDEKARHSVILHIPDVEPDTLVMVAYTIVRVVDRHRVQLTIEEAFKLEDGLDGLLKGHSYLIGSGPLPFLVSGLAAAPEFGANHNTRLMLFALHKWTLSNAARPTELVRKELVV